MIVDNIDMASRLPGQLSESKETSGIASIVAFCRQAYVHLQVPVIIYKVHVANILALFILGEGATIEKHCLNIDWTQAVSRATHV